MIQTHLFAAFSLSREASKGMLERGCGSILFTASMTSFIGMTQVVAYSAAKSAYLGVVRALAAEWSSKGVRVNAIAPGWICLLYTSAEFHHLHRLELSSARGGDRR